MSAEAVGWVWRHSPATKSALLVHLAIADVANDMHDNQLWCSVATLAEKTHLDRSTVMKALDGLVEHGLLTEKERPGRTTLYQFQFLHEGVGNSDTLSDMPVGNPDTPVGESDTTSRKSRHELNRTQADNCIRGGEKIQCMEWAPLDERALTVAPCALDTGHDGPCEPKRPVELVAPLRADTEVSR